MTDTPRTAVCFDLDYTLVDFDRPFDELVREALAPQFDDIATETMDDAIEAMLVAMGEAMDDQDPDAFRLGATAAFDAAGVDGDADAVHERLQAIEFEHTSVAEPAREAIATLADDDSIVVCVLTDGHGEWQRAKLAHHGLEEYVEHVVTSYDVGGAKVTGAPYDRLRELVDADEYVMIGDDYEGDVEAARDAGFVPIHYEETDGPDFFATLSAML